MKNHAPVHVKSTQHFICTYLFHNCTKSILTTELHHRRTQDFTMEGVRVVGPGQGVWRTKSPEAEAKTVKLL